MNRVGLLALSVICLAKNSLGTAPTNIALNKTSKQRGQINYPSSRANDGDLGTRAITTSVKNAYWFVDLEEQVHVTFIRLVLEQKWPNLYVGVGNIPPERKKLEPGTHYNVCKKFTGFPCDWRQKIPCNIIGRYVVLYLPRGGLSIVEVEVYNTTGPGGLSIGKPDLARGKIAKLSSSRYDKYSYHGNDGNPDTMASTNIPSPPAYWSVDLEGYFQMTSIVLYYVGNWTNLIVGVGDKPTTRTSRPLRDFQVCHTFPRKPDDFLNTITCEKSGRYVIIFSNVTPNLIIKEVQVYGIRTEAPTTLRQTTTIEPVTTKEPSTTIEPDRAIQSITSIEPVTATEPNSTLDLTTAKPDEKKHIDWMYWIFTFIFFALLPLLGNGACYVIKSIRADRAKERRLSALRDTSQEEDTDVISNKKLQEERDTEALNEAINPIAPGESKNGLHKSRKRIATISRMKKPRIVRSAKSTPKASSSAKKLPNASVAKTRSGKSTPKTKRSLASNKQLAKSKSALTGRSIKTTTKSFVSLASTPQAKGLSNKSTKGSNK